MRQPPEKDTAATPRGRFAPSPTGSLHLGSLVTALASWLDMRTRGGEWLVRIDDIDPPREVPGAADTILHQLEVHGLEHDGSPYYQRQRGAAFAEAVETLLRQGDAFHCALSRRQLAEYAGVHPGPSVAVGPGPDRAVRLCVPDTPVSFQDELQGTVSVCLAREGPFVIRRRDGLFAYQLASALDEVLLEITDVMRGADLLESTARQLHVLHCLGHRGPRWAHLPLVVDEEGRKLSKSEGAAALAPRDPAANLVRALQCLGMVPPPELRGAQPRTVLEWAREHWQRPTSPAAVRSTS